MPTFLNNALPTERKENPWVNFAYHCYEQSTTYLDNNYRKMWEDSLRHFQNKHSMSSKYQNARYKYRSKYFRPKTRATIRSNEAAAVAAFFSNPDVVSIEPLNEGDPVQQASAEVMQALVNYRLDKSIPWFQIAIGAVQDAAVVGAICSYQCWEYEAEDISITSQIVGPDGQSIGQPDVFENVKKDRPAVYLLPIENVRIHPAASWIDPVNSSPYFIRRIPMYVEDIKARMRFEDPKTGKPKWRQLTDDQIKVGLSNEYDTTRNIRDQKRTDPMDESQVLKELFSFDIGWVHENYMRQNGKEVVWYTLGTDWLLQEPVPIEQIYATGERPIVIGTGLIETHRIMPDSLAGITIPLQEELNENANQRLDNVKLVMNKRFLVRRGRQVDIKSLLRNVPASVTMTSAPDDVMPIEFSDVTGSAYQEQDRLNLDYDELAGTFSPSSINQNRRAGETVGGMAMMRGSSNAITEYFLRCIAETWMEKTLKQLVKLEQRYETDLTILTLAAEKSKVLQRYGVNQITDELLDQELTIRVNVGMGSTDPILKVSNFMLGLEAIGQAHVNLQGTGLNMTEITNEIFGRLGHRDAQRFWTDPEKDPEMQRMMQIIEQLQAALQEASAQIEDKMLDRRIQVLLEQMKQLNENQRTELKQRVDITKTIMQEKGAMDRERLKLFNPVAGERPPAAQKYPRVANRPMLGRSYK